MPGALAPPPQRPRRFVRILAIVGVVLVLAIGSIVGVVFMVTQSMAKAGNDFVAIITGPHPATAWRTAGPDLQQAISEPDFAAFRAARGWQGATVSWNSRSRNDSDGRLRGTITSPSGQATPIRLVLRKNSADVWQGIGLGYGNAALVD